MNSQASSQTAGEGRQQSARAVFKSPEGLFPLAAERRLNYTFQPDLPTRLTLADLSGASSGQFLAINYGQRLCIVPLGAVDTKEPAALVTFSQPGSGSQVVLPTSHAHTSEALDEYDLAVGLNTGEVVLMSLRAQLRTGGLGRPATALSLNIDGSLNASRCVAVAWVPGSQGRSFITAHRDGGVYLHTKVVGNSSDSKLLARSNSQQTLRPPVTTLQAAGNAGVTAAAPSPDGSMLAVACKDGVLRLFDLATTSLVGGFKSYYGGLLCCCWSPDGRYVAAGGEDDLVSVYGLAERCLVAVGQGHSSWVSQVSFDPSLCHSIEQPAGGPLTPQAAAGEATLMSMDGGGPWGETIYRLASVGQDCQLLLWDVVVSEETLAAAPSGPSPFKNGREHSASATAAPGPLLSRELGAGSGGRGSGGALPACIAPSMPRVELPLMPSIAQQKIHAEPLSDVLFTTTAMLTACHGANVKVWQLPAATGSQASLGASEG